MTSQLLTSLRRTAAVLLSSAALVGAGLVLATPAGADTPEGWPDEPPIDKLEAILVLGGIPLALFVAIWLLAWVPSLVRGERIGAAHPATESQWFGGPRKTTAELAAPDTSDSQAGGASARW